MNIHEYQAKGLLAKYGVAVPRGGVAFTPDEAMNAARRSRASSSASSSLRRAWRMLLPAAMDAERLVDALEPVGSTTR